MKLITPDRISFSASISEDDVRERMTLEVLEQIGGLTPEGKPHPELRVDVHRGESRKGGYTITVTGPMPVQMLLPPSRS